MIYFTLNLTGLANCSYGDADVLYHFGNGICNEELNTEECLFDGNDCCLPYIWSFEFDDPSSFLDDNPLMVASCFDCICHLDGQRHPDVSEFS